MEVKCIESKEELEQFSKQGWILRGEKINKNRIPEYYIIMKLE